MTQTAALPHQILRAATHAAHEKVDSRFSCFDLTDFRSYGRFLSAHARVLPAIEAGLQAHDHLPPFEPRTAALRSDLAALALATPDLLALPFYDSLASAWGAFYVVEGSRLGGLMLSRLVPATLPRAYLSSSHPRGGWRTILTAMDEAAAARGDDWVEEAVRSARLVFDLYDRAAAMELDA